MKPYRRPSFGLLLGTLIAMSFGLLVAVPSPSRGEEQDREKQIREIERQIAELSTKLAELRNGTAPAPSPQTKDLLPPGWVQKLSWRCIGPATMGGRIVALAVCESDPSTYWIATASGGLLKTTNNGVTFEHQFDREATVSIGDVAVAPSNKNIVWVGTGENNPRNSVSYGDGVYRSIDGGKTWKNVGLQKTYQIGRIAIHPKDPDIVYVGALGRLYGPNPDRGVFKTTDGGKTWNKVLHVNDETGVIDVAMNPADPETLLIAAWERRRDEYDSHPGDAPMEDGYDGYDPIKKWGPGSGIYKTTNGGKDWTKLTKGLPTCPMGRIGLDWYRKDPKTVFAIVDSAKIAMGTPAAATYLGVQGENVEGGAKILRVNRDGPAAQAGLEDNDIIKAVDTKAVKSYDEVVTQVGNKKPGDNMALTVLRGQETKEITVTLGTRPEEQQGPPVAYAGLNGQDSKESVLVTVVTPNAPAAKAGIQKDDEILAVEGKPVNKLQQLIEAVTTRKPGDKLTLTVRNNTGKKDIVVELGTAPPRRPTRPYSAGLGGQVENAQDKQGPNSHEYGGIYKSADGGESWVRINSLNPRPMYFSLIRVDPSDDKYLYVLGVALHRSSDGGKTFKPDGAKAVHPDQHCLWIDPKDGRHMIVGTDGGTYATYDRMDNWDFLNHAAVGQFYHVCVDNRKPYWVYGGMQDNGSWGGPSRSLSGGVFNDDWIGIGGGDGFVCQVDREDPDVVYWESQDGGMQRRNLKTGERASLRPGGFQRRQPGQTGQPTRPNYRFNWNTPFILSNHNPRIFYSAGNHVFRSVNRGEDQKVFSPEITRTQWGSGTALSESPMNPDVLWAGTDDGYLWITRDGGKNWKNVTANLKLPGPRWVTSIEASRAKLERAYVVLDGHRSDDDEPYVFVTEDFGETWKSLRNNLPWGSTRVLREDITNPNLLYLGTEFAAWASINRGESWTKINNNLPTVAVHEFAQHPTAGEMVAATHGRSLWVLDVTALRQMKPSLLTEKVHLFQPGPAIRWRSEPARGPMYGSGSRRYVGTNPPPGTAIAYLLSQKAEKVTLKVVDYAGKTVRELRASADPGLHVVQWDVSRASLRPGGTGGQPRPFSEAVTSGMYRVVLTVDGQELSQGIKVEADPIIPAIIAAEEEEKKERKFRLDD